MATSNHIAKNLLRPSRAPRLPSPSPIYSRENFDQIQSSLRLYFNELDGLNQALYGPFGSRFLNSTYGSFSSIVDQIAANTTTAYPMEMEVTELANGTAVLNNTATPAKATRLTVEYPGIYNIQFSAQFTNSDSLEQDASVWFRKNGTDIANSNSQFTVASRHGSVDGALVAALNFYVEMLGGDYVEIMWSVSNTSVSIQHIAAQTTPTRPVTPSVIATIAFVSSIPE